MDAKKLELSIVHASKYIRSYNGRKIRKIFRGSAPPNECVRITVKGHVVQMVGVGKKGVVCVTYIDKTQNSVLDILVEAKRLKQFLKIDNKTPVELKQNQNGNILIVEQGRARIELKGYWGPEQEDWLPDMAMFETGEYKNYNRGLKGLGSIDVMDFKVKEED